MIIRSSLSLALSFVVPLSLSLVVHTSTFIFRKHLFIGVLYFTGSILVVTRGFFFLSRQFDKRLFVSQTLGAVSREERNGRYTRYVLAFDTQKEKKGGERVHETKDNGSEEKRERGKERERDEPKIDLRAVASFVHFKSDP